MSANRKLSALVLGVFVACGTEPARDAGEGAAPEAIGAQEDPVCGMLVRDQSAPRAQVVHRDGERFFFCSLGDLLVHLSAPSSHGSVVQVFVEVLGPDEDPAVSSVGAHRWVPAESAVYVVGVSRSGIMGEPVLAYARVDDARAVADGVDGANTLDFERLREHWRRRQEER